VCGGHLQLALYRPQQEPQPPLVRHAGMWECGEGEAVSAAEGRG